MCPYEKIKQLAIVMAFSHKARQIFMCASWSHKIFANNRAILCWERPTSCHEFAPVQCYCIMMFLTDNMTNASTPKTDINGY